MGLHLENIEYLHHNKAAVIATVNIIENSSYVLISIILSVRLRTDESTSPDHQVNKQSRSNCHGFILY